LWGWTVGAFSGRMRRAGRGCLVSESSTDSGGGNVGGGVCGHQMLLQSLVKSLFAEAIFRIQKRTSPHQPPPTIVVYTVNTERISVVYGKRRLVFRLVATRAPASLSSMRHRRDKVANLLRGDPTPTVFQTPHRAAPTHPGCVHPLTDEGSANRVAV
jgi:hypothetical protein